MAEPVERFVALRHRDFRLVWASNFVSIVGTQMQLVAINWHIYTLLAGATLSIPFFGRSLALSPEALGLGGVGLVRVIPIALFALIGGNLADIANRRTLLIWTNAVAAGLALSLAVANFAGHDALWVIYLLTALTSATAAFSGPAFQSLIPNLVPREHLTNAISLNSIVFQAATITGPALAGLMMSRLNVGWVYVVNALSFGAIIVALADLASSLPASPSVTRLVGDLLSRAPQPEVYAFLASTIVASRRPELVGVLIESLPREMSQKRLRSALEALRLAPKDAATERAIGELEVRLANQAPPSR